LDETQDLRKVPFAHHAGIDGSLQMLARLRVEPLAILDVE